MEKASRNNFQNTKKQVWRQHHIHLGVLIWVKTLGTIVKEKQMCYFCSVPISGLTFSMLISVISPNCKDVYGTVPVSYVLHYIYYMGP